jgi:hypothetical protein
VEIKNPVFLKRPWLFPVCTTIGAALVFRPGVAISLTIKVVVFLFVVVTLNAVFFTALKRTRQNQSRNPPQF